MSITIQIEKHGDWDHVTYVGPINEDAEVHLGSVPGKLGSKVLINFKQVQFVNSCGVRAWINFLRELEKGREIIFEECTPEIMSQINMIPNFKSTATIRSLYAAYACPNCDHQSWRLFQDGENMPASPEDDISPQSCEKCGNEMEMEELEDEFFAWLEAS
jgi:anti-anti-sigma regulatory factor